MGKSSLQESFFKRRNQEHSLHMNSNRCPETWLLVLPTWVPFPLIYRTASQGRLRTGSTPAQVRKRRKYALAGANARRPAVDSTDVLVTMAFSQMTVLKVCWWFPCWSIPRVSDFLVQLLTAVHTTAATAVFALVVEIVPVIMAGRVRHARRELAQMIVLAMEPVVQPASASAKLAGRWLIALSVPATERVLQESRSVYSRTSAQETDFVTMVHAFVMCSTKGKTARSPSVRTCVQVTVLVTLHQGSVHVQAPGAAMTVRSPSARNTMVLNVVVWIVACARLKGMA